MVGQDNSDNIYINEWNPHRELSDDLPFTEYLEYFSPDLSLHPELEKR